MSSNMIGNLSFHTLANRKVSSLCKAFANNLSASKKLSKAQLSKIILLGEFFGRLAGS